MKHKRKIERSNIFIVLIILLCCNLKVTCQSIINMSPSNNNNNNNNNNNKIVCVDKDNRCRMHNNFSNNCPIDWLFLNPKNSRICRHILDSTCCIQYNKIIFDKLNNYGKNTDKFKKRKKRRNIPSVESIPNMESRLKRRAIMGKGDGRMRVC